MQIGSKTAAKFALMLDFRFSNFFRFSIFDLGAIVQSTGRRGISISISGYGYPYLDPDMPVQWICSGGESQPGIWLLAVRQ
jgi:hypothetical protein